MSATSARRALVVIGLTTALLTAACGSTGSKTPPTTEPSAPGTTSTATPSASPPSQVPSPGARHTTGPPPGGPSGRPALGSVPPNWLGTRVLARQANGFGKIEPTPPELRDRRFTLPDKLPELPGTGFASRITTPAPAAVIARSTWRPGCPVAATDLSWVRLTFRGFDGSRHTGELLVNRSAASAMVQVFERLWEADFPIEQMSITTRAEQDAPPTGDGNDTESFNCRPVVGATSYSQHAYGLAVDLDPFQNPYVKGDLVLPELASAYADRNWNRPGMIQPDDVVVRAFASVGWGWGGSWRNLKDYQHFSANGR